MHAVVLLAGPSLGRLSEIPTCDVSISGKRAGLAFACTWSVIIDSPALVEFGNKLAGNPLLLSRREYWPKYTDRPGLAVEELRLPTSHYQTYTSAAALALAGYLGASTVDVYGADFGDSDVIAEFDGHIPDEHNYGENRWEREKDVWRRVVEWLSGRGCTVHRIGY